MHDDDFWNQWPWVILGAEGEGDGGDDDSDDDGDDSDDDGDDDANDDADKDSKDKPTGKSQEDFDNLQKALAAERRTTKRLERENKRFKAAQDVKSEAENETVEEATKREQAATARAEKLAAGLLKRDVDTAIKEAARELKFLDVEDALNGVDRSKIVFDQDDEDPTDIDIDEATVKAVVKALAARKPHFLNKGTDDGEATGSQFGGSKKRKQSSEEALREVYPSL